MKNRFEAFPQEQRDALASALAEYVADRWGESGAYLEFDDADQEPTVILLAECLHAGGEPGNAAHSVYLAPAVMAVVA